MTLPKPYYHDERAGITIYNADCRDLLPHIEPVDLVLTDPPYGIDGGRGGNAWKYGKGDYIGSWEDTPKYIAEVCVSAIKTIIDRGVRCVVTPGVKCMFLYPPPNDIGCFFSPASAGCGPWGFRSFHPIFYYGKDPFGGKGSRPSGWQLTEMADKSIHPCPKPIGAWTKLMDRSSTAGETVLDPFMGSGTTLRAAKDLGRKAIGIEIEEKYCEIAVKRLAQEVLF